MIARTWRGVTRAEDREAYLDYLRRTGLAAYASTEGHRGALVLSRTGDDRRSEFLVVSLWDSEDAVRAFAGERPERAVFYPDDERFLVERESRATHYDVLYRDAPWQQGGRIPEVVHARGWRIAGFR